MEKRQHNKLREQKVLENNEKNTNMRDN